MRRGPGDQLRGFNARDGEFAAQIETASKRSVSLRIGARLRAPAPESDLWLLFAPVKRDAVDLIAQKATELGVGELRPVETERTNAARIRVDRLAAIAVEAAEQCGRLSVPAVRPLEPLDAALAAWPVGRTLIFCDESGDDPDAEWGGAQGRAPPLVDALKRLPPGPLAVIIGPEGGFTPRERQRLRALAFVAPAGLGPRILRADTAAIVALALCQAIAGGWRAPPA
jgi:16S rRNA (uracil1498-N3)-methyltransferase